MTHDELAQFHEQRMAHLFASAPPQATEATARETRIQACLNFCRNISEQELVDSGLQPHAARSSPCYAASSADALTSMN